MSSENFETFTSQQGRRRRGKKERNFSLFLSVLTSFFFYLFLFSFAIYDLRNVSMHSMDSGDGFSRMLIFEASFYGVENSLITILSMLYKNVLYESPRFHRKILQGYVFIRKICIYKWCKFSFFFFLILLFSTEKMYTSYINFWSSLEFLSLYGWKNVFVII